jgi:hypothetical protein
MLTNVSAQNGSFYLHYRFVGLGSNLFRKFYPEIDINGDTLTLTIQKKSEHYSVKKYGNYIDTLWKKNNAHYKLKIRPSSVDSIIKLVGNLKDTTIFDSNPCIMSGGVHLLTIATGTDTVKYKFMNTFERPALKIVHVINSYLPKENKIWATEQLIKDSEDCWGEMRKRWAQEEKK